MRRPREPLNFYTHAIPAFLAIPAAAALIFRSTTSIQCTAAIVYGLSTMILFSISATYHGYPQTPQQIRFWQKADHCCIYLMIAGSYTPTTLLVFDGWIRWGLFGIVWAIALIGCLLKMTNHLQNKSVSLGGYIAMGTLIAPFITEVESKLSIGAVAWMVGGGLLYALGTIFYYKDKALNRYLHTHEIWHLFVNAGAIAHYYYNYHYLFTS